MSDKIEVGKKVKSITIGEQYQPYTAVEMRKDSTTVYRSALADDNGRTLLIENPYATQQACDAVLEQIQGYKHQPYSAKGVMLNPAAELGDAVDMKGIYGGIFAQDFTLNNLGIQDISAVDQEEVNHEYATSLNAHNPTYMELLNGEAEIDGKGLISSSVGSVKLAGGIGKGLLSSEVQGLLADVIYTNEIYAGTANANNMGALLVRATSAFWFQSHQMKVMQITSPTQLNGKFVMYADT